MSFSKLLIALLFCLCGCQQESELPHSEPPPVPVLASQVDIQDRPVYVESIGSLHPSVFIEIRPEMSGIITDIFIKEGQEIEQGTALAKIDSKPFQIRLKELQAQLMQDQASLQAAQKKWNRYKGLAQKDLIAQTEWDSLETEIARLEASVQGDEARIEKEQFELSRCLLKAPNQGKIGKVSIHPGSLVSSQQPLFTLSTLDPLRVEFTLNEKEYRSLSDNNKEIELELLSDANLKKEGTITFFDNYFDPKTGLILVRGDIPNEDKTFHPGQYVKVKILVGEQSNVKVIPAKAVKYSQEGPYVFVVQEDHTVGFRPIKTGEEWENKVVILEGLQEGDLVITDGHLRLSPGLKVEAKL